MKKILVFILPLFLFACSNDGDGIKFNPSNNNQNIDDTNEVVDDVISVNNTPQNKPGDAYVSPFDSIEMEGVINSSDVGDRTTDSNVEISSDLNLPVNKSSYGEPVAISSSSFTYGNINNFNINIDAGVSDLNCENVGDYLFEIYSWHYWNSCTTISDDLFSINVLSLSGENYIYEKQYFNSKYSLYGKVLLEQGEGLSGPDLANKNTELRGVDFERVTALTDSLFNDIK